MNASTIVRKSLKGGWILFLALLLVFKSLDLEWIKSYLSINWVLLLAQVLMMPAVVYFNKRLLRSSPIMRAGILKGLNLKLMGLSASLVGLLMSLLLLTILPQAALLEETLFRLGTDNWVDAIYRSVLFGATHMLFGVPLGPGLIVVLFGMFFSWLYFLGGLPLAVQGHFQYDLLMMLMISYDIAKKLRK
jgi:hypothetical protein